MSNPEITATQPENLSADSAAKPEPTVEELAEIAEKRRRDTQAAYTKSQQKLKAIEAENAKLKEQLEARLKVELTPEDQDRLDELKYEDLEAWREEMNKIESRHISEARANLDELTGEARKAAEQEFELERRRQVLEEFNASVETPITDEIIANEIPPRITKKLAEGTITFEEFLSEVSDYLGTGKVVKNEIVLNQPSLSEMAGGSKPSNYKPEASLSDSYSKTIF